MFGGLFGALMGRKRAPGTGAIMPQGAMGAGMQEIPVMGDAPMEEKQMPGDVMGAMMGGLKANPPAVGNPMGGAMGRPFFGGAIPRVPGGGFIGGMMGGLGRPRMPQTPMSGEPVLKSQVMPKRRAEDMYEMMGTPTEG